MATLIEVVFIVVKFVPREISQIVRYSRDPKKLNFSCLSNCRYYADHAQNLSWPASNIWLTLFQISSKSVHLRRSYSRTCEDRSFAPYSICMIGYSSR